MFSKIFAKLTKKFSVEQTVVETNPKVAPTRIGDLGEYKINIQLDQLLKNSKHLSDLLLPNKRSKSGYSQIDHVVLTPHAIFVIETKNYAGTIYGERNRVKWSVNGRFPMVNPFNQNYGHIQAIKSVLGIVDDIYFVSMVSFTRRCTFKVNEELRKMSSNDLIVYDTELSDFIVRKLNVLRLQQSDPLFLDDDILQMYKIIDKSNIRDPLIRKQHVERIIEKQDTENSVHEIVTCDICGIEVSEKVKVFCHTNKKRFKGKVYCFEHQRINE
ncbi:nuclease-related domain-containing protein [Bacillus sp. 31A1R]|uniref:Nuclease-related domain-containing protein n=1 Tax=Robertmurraya mangrovi TaxID=3098077 RepID=A0ABU5J481_9BACI|nr:nuclease-related domain-containing protein [Bacillus sp. 31A1R]MDZ5474157.1 nuclease-related domain-containing protein [Bacillus sp. 31A1R]